jgi:Asp-tRNA(Asn)/Glu-tRNA(Gln) amidotransferase A subunit family amidase
MAPHHHERRDHRMATFSASEFLDVNATLAALERGELSSLELIEQSIARIEALDGLLGVPMTVKRVV